uniref:Uncharacterized protein n=1 Tax=Rhizophora mucronata TaxID=61149 RepID=A0A2P2QPA6_RHIMU
MKPSYNIDYTQRHPNIIDEQPMNTTTK